MARIRLVSSTSRSYPRAATCFTKAFYHVVPDARAVGVGIAFLYVPAEMRFGVVYDEGRSRVRLRIHAEPRDLPTDSALSCRLFLPTGANEGNGVTLDPTLCHT